MVAKEKVLNVEISTLTPADLGAIDDLMKGNGQTLGFLPANALSEYLRKGTVFGAKTRSGRLIGYLLYAQGQSRFRIVHLCVAQDFRGSGIASRLLDELKSVATTQVAITLNCRRDFPAHHMWPKLGFVPIGERPGRSAAGHLLTLWHLTLGPTSQMDLGLFKAQTSDETVDVIIDAQVFYDLAEIASDDSDGSKALLSDFLVDSLNLWTTDELFNEIDRNDDPAERQAQRTRMQQFPQVTYSWEQVDDFYGRLTDILPDRTDSQISDIRHLAKAASSDVKVFVTNDGRLLRKAQEIGDITNLRLLSPTELIIELHELLEWQSYEPDRVSGLRLGLHRFTAHDHTALQIDSFINEGEARRRFRAQLDRYLDRPNENQCELLKAEGRDVAIRVISPKPERNVSVPLARVARLADRALFGRFLIADTVAKAVNQGQDMVVFDSSGLSQSLAPDLTEMGFTRSGETLTKFCFSDCLDREEVLHRIGGLSPHLKASYDDMSDLDLERCCSPVSLGASQNNFLIPIKPNYAMSLFDKPMASSDMFGGDPQVLLRWENVYYRNAKTSRRILRPPGRILWYVSGSQKQIVAVSHLDEVVIDTPKELLRQFKKFGVLGWNDLYQMCAGDIARELMALRFSHTFVFRRRIPLNSVRAVYDDEGIGLVLRGTTSMPGSLFQKLFKLGFPASS